MNKSLKETLTELKLDQAELEKLSKLSERRKIKDLLTLEAAKIATQLQKLEEEATQIEAGGENVSKPVSVVVPQRKSYEVKLNEYAWGQSKTNVTFYVNLPKVETIPKENVTCTFQPQSLELRIRGLENKDYLFVINKLLHAIDPEKSSIVIKTDSIKILAAKVDQTQTWSHVTLLEQRASEAKKFKTPGDGDSSGDGTQGLVDIMRDMYNQGDDEMKRTIAKAWAESQSKGPAF
ncbi:calcyclin-binding protein [Onthophagus taurus]|uniref:calcyclin-binding protein n=1 Tax=Onthophagus taurus TaxID=166361 RepID=UPI000C20251C|nr:calcyclin-binding protein [Onthophagus taurus]